MRLKRKIILCLISLIVPACILGAVISDAWAQAAPKEIFEVEISCGYDGYGKYSTYIPIHLTVTNHGEDFVGEAQIIFDGESYDDRVAYAKSFLIASGETRQIALCVPENGMSATFTVFINDESGDTVYSKKVRSQLWYTNDIFMGVLTDDFNGLNYLEGMPFYINSYGEYVDTRLFALDENSMADTASALELLDIIVINNYDTSLLSEEQYEALKIWVSNGGILLIGTGADYSKTLSLFEDDYLTGTIGSLTKTESDFGLDNFTGAKRVVPMTYTEEVILDVLEDVEETEPAQASAEMTVAETTATPYPQNTEEEKTEDEVKLGDVVPIELNTIALTLDQGMVYDKFLCHKVNKGAGTVVVFEFDLAESAFGQWDMNTYAIQNILGSTTMLRTNGTEQSQTYSFWYIEEMLTNFIGKYLPGIGRYVVILIIYILLLSPLMYLVLKRLDKRHLFWGIVPVSACVFTLLMFVLGNNTRQKEPYMNYGTILNTDYEQGVEKTYFSVISPKNNRYTFDIDDMYMISPVLNRYYSNGGYASDDNYYEMMFKYDAAKTTIDVRNVRAFDAKYFVAERESKLLDNLEVSISYEKDYYSGTITNSTGYAIEDAIIYYGSNMLVLGDIPKDGAVTVDENTQLMQNVDYYYIAETLYPTNDDDEDESITTRRKMLRGYAYALRDNNYSNQLLSSTYQIIGFVPDYPVEVSSLSGMESNGNTIISQKFELEKSKDGTIYIPSMLTNSLIHSGEVDVVYYNFWSDEAEFDYTLPYDVSVVSSLDLNSEPSEELLYWIYNWQTDSYEEIFVDTKSFDDFAMDVYAPLGSVRIRLEKVEKGTYSSVQIPEICLTGRE